MLTRFLKLRVVCNSSESSLRPSKSRNIPRSASPTRTTPAILPSGRLKPRSRGPANPTFLLSKNSQATTNLRPSLRSKSNRPLLPPTTAAPLLTSSPFSANSKATPTKCKPRITQLFASLSDSGLSHQIRALSCEQEVLQPAKLPRNLLAVSAVQLRTGQPQDPRHRLQLQP